MKRIAAIVTLSTLCLSPGSSLPAADLSSSYEWKPVNIGAGGYADGFICSSTDPNVRFVRDDTGQFYRWSAKDARWLPMVVQNDDGSGFGKDIIPEPSHCLVAGSVAGINSFALDPNDHNILYLYLPFSTPGGVGYGSLPCNVYKSTDGGKNFTATHFNDAAGFTMKANDTFCDEFRQDDDCLMVDPNNSKVLYIGTGIKGLFKSIDGGDHWTALTGGGLPVPRGKNDINILPYKKGGTIVVNGATVSKIIYVVYAKGLEKKNSAAEGNVYQSSDGGQTWNNITKDAGPTEICRGGVLDQNNGVLYVRVQNWDPKGKRGLWKYVDGNWKMIKTDVIIFAVDPANSNNLITSGAGFGDIGATGDSSVTMGGNTSISTDGGKTWKSFKRGHLRTPSHGFAGIKGEWCYGQMRMDNWGTVWMIVGNNGVLKWKFDPNATDILWAADEDGVENLVGMDIVFPRNWGGKFLVSCGDEIAFIINNPDTFDITPLLQDNRGGGYGHTISVCPNDPNTILVDGSQTFITLDGGKTFVINGLRDFVGSQVKNKHGWGALRISRRGDWKAGSDHLVGVFNGGGAWYSKDGGNTWSQSNNDFSKAAVPTAPWSSSYDLVADPFTPDKFYVYFDQGGFWTTTDGGVTWTQGATPKDNMWHQLCANEAVQNDLWVATTTGLFHSPDAGTSWQSVSGNAGLAPGGARLAIGKGSGRPGDAPYTLYYVYVSTQRNQPAKDEGIYRSTNAGASWDRICKRPYGFLCAGGTIAASWDTFGLICVNVSGQSFVYGKLK